MIETALYNYQGMFFVQCMNSINEQYRVNEMETCRTDFSIAAGQYKK